MACQFLRCGKSVAGSQLVFVTIELLFNFIFLVLIFRMESESQKIEMLCQGHMALSGQ